MKKGFTLIELIVVIAIIGVLVGLSTVGYKGYTKEAKLAEYKNNIKVLENASEQYYLQKGDWPRASEEHFTAEQLEDYSKGIYNKTGEHINIDPYGKYYTIDYTTLSKYVQSPKNKENYIIQNPVGEIYYLKDLTDIGKEKLGVVNDIPEKPIIFRGLGPEAFDKDPNTSYLIGNTTQYIEWEGNLDNKKISIDGVSYKSNQSLSFIFLDSIGNVLKPLTLAGTEHTGINILTRDLIELIVPEGTVKIKVVGNRDGSPRIHDIYVGDNLSVPKEVTSIKSIPTESSITLNWDQSNSNYSKAAIYRDGIFIGFSTGKTYIDTPLYSNQEHNYEIQSINEYSNASSKVKHVASTTRPEITFRGLSPAAFDKNDATYFTVKDSLQNITWQGNLTNKVVNIQASYSGSNSGHATIYFKDSNNTSLKFFELGGQEITQLGISRTKTNYRIIVPEGATKIVFTTGIPSTGSNGHIYDVYVEDSL